MKILYISNARIPTEKAHGNAIMKMCEAFTSVGNELELVVPWRFNHIKENPFSYYSVIENFKIKKIFSFDLVKFGKVGFYIQFFSFSIFSTLCILFKKVDIIYSRDELPLYLMSFFRKNLVWEIHTAKNNFVVKRVLMKARKIICITQGLKDYYIDTYNIDSNKILVASSAIDLKKFDIKESKEKLREVFSLPLDKKIIGYIGKYKTMGESKGVEELIGSFGEVLSSNPEAFLLLVGINKEELNDVKNQFKKNNINSSDYKIVCHVQTDKIPKYLKSCNILVMNYPNKEHYAKYMSPVKMFEYMASGIPIVASDLPSIREVLNDENSVLVNSNNFLFGIKKVLNDKIFAESISRQAFIDVQKNTWNRRVKKLNL